MRIKSLIWSPAVDTSCRDVAPAVAAHAKWYTAGVTACDPPLPELEAITGVRWHMSMERMHRLDANAHRQEVASVRCAHGIAKQLAELAWTPAYRLSTAQAIGQDGCRRSENRRPP